MKRHQLTELEHRAICEDLQAARLFLEKIDIYRHGNPILESISRITTALDKLYRTIDES